MIQYLIDSKDVQRVLAKYEERTLVWYEAFLKNDGARAILTCPLDKEGEHISESFVEAFRKITTEEVCAVRKEGLRDPVRSDYWKMELERRI